MNSKLVYLVVLMAFCTCKGRQGKADLIISNAIIWPANESQPYAESMAITDDSTTDLCRREAGV